MTKTTATGVTFAETTPDGYHYMRTAEISGRTVRARITRHSDPHHCYAVAEVQSDDTHNWLAATAAPRPGIDPAHELEWLAQQLINRAGALLAPTPRFALSPYAMNALSALLATAYNYGGEETLSPETIVWALHHGGPFHVIEHPDGSVTFTKAHRADCPFVTSSGLRECDDECVFD